MTQSERPRHTRDDVRTAMEMIQGLAFQAAEIALSDSPEHETLGRFAYGALLGAVIELRAFDTLRRR